MLLELPVTKLTQQFLFKENKSKFHKIYAVRISFTDEYYSTFDAHPVINEWIEHHKAAFNSVWLQPEFCPSSRRLHYHGFVDVKDQISLKKFLNKFKNIGSFHLEKIKSTPQEYLAYCMKETGQTEALDDMYINLYRTPKVPAQQEATAF